MSNIKNTINNIICSPLFCLVLTAVCVAAAVLTVVLQHNVEVGLLEVRAFAAVIMILIVGFVVLSGRKPLFITCICWGIACCFLSNIWNICNFIWRGGDMGLQLVESISQIGLFMFLFTASYGAIDSLADDGSRSYRKYRVYGIIAAAVVTVIWFISLGGAGSLFIVINGAALTALTYIVIKQLFIPDIDQGFVKPLRPYNFVLVLLIAIKLAELVVIGRAGGEGMEIIISGLRFIEVVIALWIYPMAGRGVKKWALA